MAEVVRNGSNSVKMEHNSENRSKPGREDSNLPLKRLKMSSPMAEMETTFKETWKYYNTGDFYFKMGKYNDAVAQYNKAIETCPKENVENLAVFYENRAAAYEQLKKYSAVKADCTKALEQNPKYTRALLRRARVLEQIGDLEAALKDMTTVCIHENFSDQSSLVKADNILEKLANQHARENLANKKSVMPNEHFIKLYIVVFPKDPVFSRLKCPENIPEFFKKPLQALKDTKYDDVIPLCTEIIESPEFDTLPSTKLEVVLLRATFYTFLNENDSAIQDFESILNSEYASDDVKINTLLKRADLYKGLKNKEMVFKDFDLAISINPSCSDIYYHRGLTYVYMHLLDKAKPDFEKAIKYNPNFSIACIQKSYVDYQIGMLNDDKRLVKTAIRTFEAIFMKYPTLPECIYCYVLFRGMMSEIRQYRKAHTYFTKIAKRYPKDPSMSFVYLQRAFLQLDWDNDFDKAMKYLHKAIELDEKCDAAYKALAIIEIKRGNVQKAIRLLDKALIYCCTSKELLNIYHLRDAAKVQLDIKNQLGLRKTSNLKNILEVTYEYPVGGVLKIDNALVDKLQKNKLGIQIMPLNVDRLHIKIGGFINFDYRRSIRLMLFMERRILDEL